MIKVYDERKDPDGFLYIVYTEESTMGAETEEVVTAEESEMMEL